MPRPWCGQSLLVVATTLTLFVLAVGGDEDMRGTRARRPWKQLRDKLNQREVLLKAGVCPVPLVGAVASANDRATPELGVQRRATAEEAAQCADVWRGVGLSPEGLDRRLDAPSLDEAEPPCVQCVHRTPEWLHIPKVRVSHTHARTHARTHR